MHLGRACRQALGALETEILAPAALVPERPGRVWVRAVKQPRSPYKSRASTTGPLAQRATCTITVSPSARRTATGSDQDKQPAQRPSDPP
jgi:hypothetical protein